MRIPFVVAMLASIALVGTNRLAASDDREDSLVELRKEKLTAATDWWDGLIVAYSNYEMADLDQLYEASIALKDAAYDIAATKNERLAALAGHQGRMEVQYRIVYALSEAKAHGGEIDNRTATKQWMIEAKVWVLEEKAKP